MGAVARAGHSRSMLTSVIERANVDLHTKR